VCPLDGWVNYTSADGRCLVINSQSGDGAVMPTLDYLPLSPK
jgi:hypothetical protein